MPNDARFVLDTGVLVIAVLLPRSVPRQSVDLAFARGIVLASADTIDELDEVLRRPKFNRYLREEERLLFLAAFIRDVKVVGVTEKLTDCRDPKDNKFLELAVSGNATCIVSSDSDLLVLNPFRGVGILTHQEFISGLKKSRQRIKNSSVARHKGMDSHSSTTEPPHNSIVYPFSFSCNSVRGGFDGSTR